MDETMERNGGEREEARRPTPVRMVMEGGEEKERGPGDRIRVFHDEETGLDWSVTLTGQSASGILPRRTVPLIELTFSKVDSPEEPLRRALCRGEDLAGLSDAELGAALKGSEPFSPPMKEAEANEKKGRTSKNRRNPRG